MVSTARFGSTLDERYHLDLGTADFRTNGHIVTSALQANFDGPVHQKNKDAIKRKLTARVSPMTRHNEQGFDVRLHPLVSGRERSHRTHGASTKTKSNVDIGSTTPAVKREREKLTEKRKFTATNVIIPAKTVKSGTSFGTRDEPLTKRPRTILPRTMQGTPGLRN